MTVTTRIRSPGRARYKPLKPLRAGMPGVSGGPVATTLVCFFYFAREAAGAAGTRHSPRPLLGKRFMHASGASRREIAGARLKLAWFFENRIRVRRPCVRRDDPKRCNLHSVLSSLREAKRRSNPDLLWYSGLLRCARNDGL
jgi:hypothetical protein